MKKKGKQTKFQGYDIPTPPIYLYRPTRPIVLKKIDTSEEYAGLLISTLLIGPALPYSISKESFSRFLERFLGDKNIDQSGNEETHIVKYDLSNVKFSSRIMSKTNK